MRSGQAVIGANFGDEGKGLMTDYFANLSSTDCTVVRFNGGAQAGHTVVSPDGARHVFSHVGAGSFSGVPTYLSEYFIVNPMLLVKELNELTSKAIKPRITVSDKAFVSTPLDMMINQIVELSRGRGRHGSCGLGINETVTRCLTSDLLRTSACDLLKPKNLASKFYLLQRDWFRQRLEELGVDFDRALGLLKLYDGEDDIERLFSRYLKDVKTMLEYVQIESSLPNYPHYIFEGAQGLLLDENRRDLFPHVTRSRTGLTNVLSLCEKLDISCLEATYVTRSYLTRHGAGPLPGESDFSFVDHTNVTNKFQGKLRFAPMNIDLISNSINLDLSSQNNFPQSFRANIAVSCLDQINQEFDLPFPVVYRSYGPSRVHVCQEKLVCA